MELTIEQQRNRALALTAISLVLFAVGYVLGSSGGVDVDAAREAGAKAGAAAGAAAGKKTGYDKGYKKGESTAYKAAYDKARAAAKKNAGL